jgi:hypothetical protein
MNMNKNKKKSYKKNIQKIAAAFLSSLIFFLPSVLMAQSFQNTGSLLAQAGGSFDSGDPGSASYDAANPNTNTNTSANTNGSNSTQNCNSSTNQGGLQGQNANGNGSTLTLCNPIKENSISQLLTDLLQIVIQIGAVVATLMFMWAGFKYLTAQGDVGAVNDAHTIFKNAAIGTGILLGAQAIVLILQNTINSVSGTNLFGGTN